eukprot:1483842-Rhodomonas_salina.1
MDSSLLSCNFGNDSSQCSTTESLWARASAQDLQCWSGLNAMQRIQFQHGAPMQCDSFLAIAI